MLQWDQVCAGFVLDFIDTTADTAKQGDMETQRGTEGGDRAGCVPNKGHWIPNSQMAVCGIGGGDSRASQRGPFYMGAEQLWSDWLLPPQHAHTGTDTCTPVTNMQQLNCQEAGGDAFERRKSPPLPASAV